MTLKDILYPDCGLCRGLRASMSVGLIIVLAVYAVQLFIINVEMNLKEREGSHGL
jgi:hypothetical protein